MTEQPGTAPNVDTPWLTMAEGALYLRISEDTLKRRLAEHLTDHGVDLRHTIGTGRTYLLARADLDQMVTRQAPPLPDPGGTPS